MKVKGFVFSEDHSEALVEGLRTPRRKGMSGCEYGPFYGPVGQAWHITSGGYLENYLPILVGRDGSRTEIPPRLIKQITSTTVAAGMLMQISQVFGRDAAEDLLDTPLATGFPLFKVYTNYEERDLGVCYGKSLRYIRPAWPETPFLRWGDFEIPVPRVGWGSVEISPSPVWTEDKEVEGVLVYNIPATRVKVGSTVVFLAQPEGQGKMYYKIGEKWIVGGEVLAGLRQNDCKIVGPAKAQKFIFFLISRRLGDLLVMSREDAEEFGLQETDDLGSARAEENSEHIILLHHEHGLLRVRKEEGKEYRVYKVPYYTPPHD